MGSCKHWTQYTERRQTKIHNTNIENRRDNQEWAAVNIGHNTQHEDKQNKIHNTSIENRRDNQEWAAVNIGHNTQHGQIFFAITLGMCTVTEATRYSLPSHLACAIEMIIIIPAGSYH